MFTNKLYIIALLINARSSNFIKSFHITPERLVSLLGKKMHALHTPLWENYFF